MAIDLNIKTDIKQKALDVLKRIDSILNEVRDFFPRDKEVKKDLSDEVKLLRRVQGIIINFNEENAERKLKSLISFIDGIKNRYSGINKE